MSEPEKVLCPYCGAEMEPADEGIIPSFYPDWYYFVCPCCQSQSPWDRSPEGAYEEALKRHKPPQRPLTIEEINALEKPWPLWMEDKELKSLHPIIRDHDMKPGEMIYDFMKHLRYWLNKPTDAERAAAKWEV